ncbi:unnamed protein product [Paramecium pentaurelia]|uniref:PSI domain-containing protein n=1 Tax=Paramecium pentaurelia TaxID=43138 RepID=A0A8S1Y9A7_9CILI|nr:unnamed protein product [Paramecium pentaurelia]
MNKLFYQQFFLIVLTQAEEVWKTVYSEFFSDSKWDTSGWQTSNIYGDPFSFCADQKLFGGYYVFGPSSLLSSHLKLPPHYSVKFSLKLWKQFTRPEGQDICGIRHYLAMDFSIPLSFTLEQHYSQSLVLIMTSNVNEYYNEAWGIQDFKIEILDCPQGCQFCQDQTSDCKFWSNIASYWQTSINSEGWQIDNTQPLISSICAGIEIAGGTNILQQGQNIKKLIDIVPSHFKVQIILKLWVIGNWDGENFILKIDDQIENSFPLFIQTPLKVECGTQQKVNITNIAVNALHTSHQIQLEMKTNQQIQKVAYWGVQSFDLYVAKCSIGCKECIGELGIQCSSCYKKWLYLDNQCTPVPPLECAHMRIQQSYGLQVDYMNSFHLYIDELDENFRGIGQTNLVLDQSISSITLQIYVQCQEQMKIESYFRGCGSFNPEQLSSLNYCPDKSNTLFQNAIFLEVLEYEKELIINIQERKLEIFQISVVNETETEILLIKIEF